MLFLPVSSGADDLKHDRIGLDVMSQYHDFCNEIRRVSDDESIAGSILGSSRLIRSPRSVVIRRMSDDESIADYESRADYQSIADDESRALDSSVVIPQNNVDYNEIIQEVAGGEVIVINQKEMLIAPQSVYVELSNFLDRDAQQLEIDRVTLDGLSVLAQYEDLHNNKQKFSSLIKLLKQENAEKIEKNKAARNKLNE